MRTIFVCIIACAVIHSNILFAQTFDPLLGDDGSQSSRQYLERLKRESPRLYELQQAIVELQKQVKNIMQRYQMNEISKADARDEIRPYLEKQLMIRQSSEYQIEQMMDGVFAEPDKKIPPEFNTVPRNSRQ